MVRSWRAKMAVVQVHQHKAVQCSPPASHQQAQRQYRPAHNSSASTGAIRHQPSNARQQQRPTWISSHSSSKAVSHALPPPVSGTTSGPGSATLAVCGSVNCCASLANAPGLSPRPCSRINRLYSMLSAEGCSMWPARMAVGMQEGGMRGSVGERGGGVVSEAWMCG
jgi:hypothetical protein